MRDRANNISTGNFLTRGRVDDWVMEEVTKYWKRRKDLMFGEG